MGYDVFVDLCDGVLDDPDLVGPEGIFEKWMN